MKSWIFHYLKGKFTLERISIFLFIVFCIQCTFNPETKDNDCITKVDPFVSYQTVVDSGQQFSFVSHYGNDGVLVSDKDSCLYLIELFELLGESGLFKRIWKLNNIKVYEH